MESSQNICVLCRQLYSSEKELIEHVEKVHSPKSQGKFHCDICNRDFRDSFNLKRHVAFLHSPKSSSKMQKTTKCLLCSKLCLKKDITGHFSSVHKVNLVEEELEFQSNELFECWKIQMENDTKSRYVKVRNVYKYKDGSYLNTFYCHRDGFVKNSKSKNLRRMKAFGSNKINGHCPSKIVMKCNVNGYVNVKFVKTHIGHAAELNRISLSKKEKEALAEKLSMNIPFDQILDDIRDSIRDSNVQRVHLLSKQDLRNIVRDFKVSKYNMISPDSSNCDVTLETMYANDAKFIRLYKPKGAFSNEFPQLKPKDYLLLVMNDLQKEILDKFGNSYLCIDLTHGIHIHDLDMYTLYVIDDMQQAFPCAFGFSNRCDLVAMELFLFGVQDIMKRIICPNLLITNEMLHDAWCAVMTTPSSYVYCTWLVDLDWRNNLKKIKDKEKQTVIYKQLRRLLEERDIGTFNRGLDELYFHLDSDDDTKDFLHYFEKYKSTREKWAYCHTKHLGECLFNLEKLHKSLKYIYLKRKKVHSIDDTLFNIMSFLRGKFLENPLITVFDKLMEIKTGHKTAINMTQANLAKISDTSWDVSGPNNEEMFRVEQVKFHCENCLIRCKPCAVCIHLYTCSCYDASIKWNMCQHIHLVCIVAKHEQSIAFNVTLEKSIKMSSNDQSSDCDTASISFAGNDSDSEHLTIIHHVNSPLKSTQEIEIKKKEILNKFTNLLESATSLEQLDLINKHLTPCEQEFEVIYQSRHGDDSYSKGSYVMKQNSPLIHRMNL